MGSNRTKFEGEEKNRRSGVMGTMGIPSIHTARLCLRALDISDAPALHAVLSQEDVLRYFPNPTPPSPDRVRTMIEGQLTHWNDHGYGWWAVTKEEDRSFIGWSGLQFLPDTSETEVAFLLGRSFWGMGFATEAGRAGLEFGFDRLGLETIVAITHPENRASQRVIEKLGMSFVDRNRYFGMDCYRYRMSRRDWGP
jgi:ribosomal-protein-alanine N-acetyltransferase